MNSIIIGVDGGGTKTKVIAIDSNDRIISSSEGGSINYNNIGIEDALSNFINTIEQLNIDYNFVRAISVGDPAQDDVCVNPYTEKFVYKIRKKLPLNPSTEIFIKSDVYMALYGLTKGEAGVLVVSGTGSMGVAIDDNGGFHVSGGWGFPVNDTGSGYDIAVDAFAHIFAFFDKYGYHKGQISGEMLAVSALDYYRVSHPRELINCFHGDHNSRAKVAEFSKIVYECAEKGCLEACCILENAGKRLANCAMNLINKIIYPSDRRLLVGIYGSVLTNNHFVKRSFIDEITRVYPMADIVQLEMPPELAAAVYAEQKIKNIQQEERHVALYR